MANENQCKERLPPVVYVLTGCVAVIGSNSLVLGPIAPEVARTLGSSTSTVMSAAAAFGLGAAASALFLARQIDRLGAWQVLRLAMAALTGALLLCAVAPHAIVLVVGQFLAGLTTGVALPAIYTSAAAFAPRGQESRTLGIVLTGWTISLVGGVSLSAVLADIFHWRAVFLCVAVPAIAAVVRLSMRAPHVPAADRAAPMPLEALKIAGVPPLLVAVGLFTAAFYGVFNYLGDHLHNGLGLPVSVNGVAALVYGLGFGAAVWLDPIVDRAGTSRSMPGALLSISVVYLGLALASGKLSGMLICVFVWGLANHVTLNVLIMRLSALDASRRGAIMGLNSAVTYFAAFVGTTAFGALSTTFGFVVSVCVASGLTAIAAFTGNSRAPVPAGLAFGSRRQ